MIQYFSMVFSSYLDNNFTYFPFQCQQDNNSYSGAYNLHMNNNKDSTLLNPIDNFESSSSLQQKTYEHMKFNIQKKNFDNPLLKLQHNNDDNSHILQIDDTQIYNNIMPPYIQQKIESNRIANLQITLDAYTHTNIHQLENISSNKGLKATEQKLKVHLGSLSSQYNPCISTQKFQATGLTMQFITYLRRRRSYDADYADRRKMFICSLNYWQHEKLIVSRTSEKYKFSKPNLYKKYRENCHITFCWLQIYRKILSENLPKIKNLLKESSIEKLIKKSMIENIEFIYQAMIYYEKLYPKNLSYAYHSDVLKMRFKLISRRLQYLYDYFNISEKFLELYEMIVEHYAENFESNTTMKIILNSMTKNLTIILCNHEQHIKNLRDKLKLLNLLNEDY
ncbi:uncharacterized protein VNE69_02025 [Vairimorpha necatrix]|uniref:Uncharacterized protein n=1 Tax=Vairimorpha necatrix TaxID=6039 RepID=A0AAX4J9A0_9MICR